jgi:hypothetical protein
MLIELNTESIGDLLVALETLSTEDLERLSFAAEITLRERELEEFTRAE